MASREAVMDALLAVLAATAEFKAISRRNRAPETITPALSPALFLFEEGEHYARQGPSKPAVRTLIVKAILYNNVGTSQNAVPASIVNDALDALDAALKPDDVVAGRFTLGGLVHSAMIDGEIVKAPGDMTGVALAIVPIKITLP